MRITKKSLVAGVAAISLGMTLAACGSSNNSSGAPSGSGSGGASGSTAADSAGKLADYNPQPRSALKQGGTLTQSLPEIPNQLNTFHADGDVYGAALWAYVNPQMAFFQPDGTWSYNKDYLTDVTEKTVNGNTVVTYTINPKAVWNDGTPITWESYKVTAEDNSGKNKAFEPSSTDGYSQIKSVTEGVNNRQAVVTFNGQWAWWQGEFDQILNPHVNTPQAFNNAYVNNLNPQWGAGPFEVQSFNQKAGTVTFVRNPKWWGEPALLDKVTFEQMEDTASINAFKNGELDIVSAATKDRLDQVKSMPDVTILNAGSVSTDLLELNSKSPTLNDPNVRKAVFESLDRNTLAQVRYQGLNYNLPLPGSFNLLPFQPGYQDALAQAGYSYNPTQAAQLLDAAGWKMGSNGIRQKNGQSLTLDYPFVGDDPTLIAQSKAMVAMAKKVGIEIKMRTVPSADFSSTFTGGKWDLFALGFSASDPFGVAYMCQLYCSDSGLNLSGTGTKAIDAEVKAVAKLPTADAQIKAALPLEAKIMSQTWGMLPTDTQPVIDAVKTGLANIGPEPYSGPDLFGVLPVENEGWQK